MFRAFVVLLKQFIYLNAYLNSKIKRRTPIQKIRILEFWAKKVFNFKIIEIESIQVDYEK